MAAQFTAHHVACLLEQWDYVGPWLVLHSGVAGYIDKDGTAWSRGGLCGVYLQRIALSVGHKAMMQSLEKMPDRIMSDFDKWITSRINKGILMRVTEKKGEME